MKFKILATESCGSSTCPTIYEIDGDRLAVQGTKMTEKPDGLPANEDVVEIPRSLLEKIAAQLLS